MTTLLLIELLLGLQVDWIYAGFGDPEKAWDKVMSRYGNPCKCNGGYQLNVGGITSQTVDCGNVVAHLRLERGETRMRWVCKQKPLTKPQTVSDRGQCPTSCIQLAAVNSRCYKKYQECFKDGKQFLTATLTDTYEGSFGGGWDPNALSRGKHYKYLGADCQANVGDVVCWPLNAPLHVSDGGGPTDQNREQQVKEWVKQQIEEWLPPVPPLYRPRGVMELLDVQLLDIMQSTHQLLNGSNPNLAANCWMCLQMTNSWPIAVPLQEPELLPLTNCSPIAPMKVVPQNFEAGPCYTRNSSTEVDLGYTPVLNCTTETEIPKHLGCLPPGQMWICGGNLGYSWFPVNSTGSCTPALLLPYMNLIPGTETIPINSIDYLGATPRRKRALAAVPLLIGLGITGSLGLGAAGLGVSMDQYTKLAERVTMHLEQIHQTLQDLQDQQDSLAQVVLQNRRGLDLILAERHGLCAALNEECCFYANKSGIVKDRIRRGQEDLAKWRKELQDRPLWSLWGGILPYILPLLGPLLSLLLIVSIGPCIFNKIISFIKERVSTVQALVLTQQHYQYQPLTQTRESYSQV